LAGAAAQQRPTVTPGRKWITLIGRNGCRDTSGWLGGEFCDDPNRLQFYSIGGSVRTTWIFRTASNTQNLVARPGVTPQVSIQVSASAPF
jgi:hypothetical protein